VGLAAEVNKTVNKSIKLSQLEGWVSNSQTLSDSPWCSLGKIIILNCPSKKHISGAGMPLIAVAKIKKKHFLAHLMLFFGVQWIFSITAISCSPVLCWAYQQVLALEVKNFAKITFLSFNTTAVFLHDAMVPENDVLEAG